MTSPLAVVTEPGTPTLSIISVRPCDAIGLNMKGVASSMLKISSVICRIEPVSSLNYFPDPYHYSSDLPLVFNPLNDQIGLTNRW